MKHLEVRDAVRHMYIYIYIYIIRRLRVKLSLKDLSWDWVRVVEGREMWRGEWTVGFRSTWASCRPEKRRFALQLVCKLA